MESRAVALFEGYEFDLFVIFADADRDFVRSYLLPSLELPRSRVFLSDELAIGATRVSEIDRGVSSSRFTVAVLSPAYLDDCWAGFGEQLASYVSLKGVHIIPLLLTKCDLPLRLDARVALDFTDRSRWKSEITRLREFLHAATRNTTDSRLGTIRQVVSGKLEIVDASFDDEADDQRYEVLDLKLINQSVSTIFINRVDITVSEIWDVCNPSLGYQEPTASYHIDIPMRRTPYVLSKQVSHVLKADEADRFQFVLSSAELQAWSNIAFVAIRTSIFYGPGERAESTDELFCAFRGAQQWWLDWTQPIAAALAYKARQRRGRMSKRALDLLNGIDARGWADNVDLLLGQAVFWTELGNKQAADGDLRSARRYLELALDIRRLLAAKNHGNSDWQRELSASNDRIDRLPGLAGQPDGSWGGVQVLHHAAEALGGRALIVR